MKLFSCIFEGAAGWDRLPWPITLGRHFPVISTVLRFEPMFHCRKVLVIGECVFVSVYVCFYWGMVAKDFVTSFRNIIFRFLDWDFEARFFVAYCEWCSYLNCIFENNYTLPSSPAAFPRFEKWCEQIISVGVISGKIPRIFKSQCCWYFLCFDFISKPSVFGLLDDPEHLASIFDNFYPLLSFNASISRLSMWIVD